MLPLLTKPLPYEVVNQEGSFVLPLKLILSEVADGVESLFLDALQDLVLGLVILVDSVDDLDRVGLPPVLVKLESAHIELLLLDGRDDFAVEEDDLPFVLMEPLWEVFEAALSQVLHVLG